MGNKTGQKKRNIVNNILKYDFNIRTKLLGDKGYYNVAKLCVSRDGEEEFDEIWGKSKNSACDFRHRVFS